jgi:ribosomal protein S18 acetylase RimI-like enzyme
MPEVEIRHAVSSDLPVFLSFEHAYQTSYVWQIERLVEDTQVVVNFREIRLPRPVHVNYPRPVDLLAKQWNQRALTLASIVNNQIVGYVSVVEQAMPGTAWIMDLVVKAEHRRQGIATAMIVAAQEWAIHRRYRRVILEMQSKNYPAVRLANKLGFEFCGYNDYYYPNQDIALFFTRFLH